MASIRSLANEFDVQTYELLALCDLGVVSDETAEISSEKEEFIRDVIADSSQD